MEILHVPSACALLRTLSIISPPDLMMDSPTRGTFRRRYWEEEKTIFAPYVTKISNYVTLIRNSGHYKAMVQTHFLL